MVWIVPIFMMITVDSTANYEDVYSPPFSPYRRFKDAQGLQAKNGTRDCTDTQHHPLPYPTARDTPGKAGDNRPVMTTPICTLRQLRSEAVLQASPTTPMRFLRSQLESPTSTPRRRRRSRTDALAPESGTRSASRPQ
jgi:hypothetical protein